MTEDLEYKEVRREAQMGMAHVWGFCFSDNCKLKYPSPKTDSDPKNYTCEEVKNE